MTKMHLNMMFAHSDMTRIAYYMNISTNFFQIYHEVETHASALCTYF